jgi:hypothetical protein
MQLVVEKYISDRQSNGKLPSRALVSLNIVNMFNKISREIIAAEFPSLEGFADKLYEEDGETYIKMEDGWAVIPVTEVHHEDVEFFLETFNRLATPLGEVLNVTKTRIMTSTSHESIVNKMLASKDEKVVQIGESLPKSWKTDI